MLSIGAAAVSGAGRGQSAPQYVVGHRAHTSSNTFEAKL